jgi:hypothetical protein
MSYVLGIDIGSVRTRAAVRTSHGRDRLRPEPVPLGTRTACAPTVLFLDEEGYLLTGDLARDAGSARPDRAIRGFHERVGDSVPVVIDGEPLSPESLSVVQVEWIVERATDLRQELPERVVVTHPAGWGGYRQGVLRAALRDAGLPGVGVIATPLAAVHGHPRGRPRGSSVTAVVECGEDGHNVALVGSVPDGDSELLAVDDTVPAMSPSDAALALVARAGLEPVRLGGVLLTGAPPVARALQGLPCPVLVNPEPELTAAMGATAPPAHRRLERPADVGLATADTAVLPRVGPVPEPPGRPERPPVRIEPFPIPPKKSLRLWPGHRRRLSGAER